MTLSPDGAMLYVAAGAPYEGRAYAVADLMQRHAFRPGLPERDRRSPNGLSVGVGQRGADAALHLFRADGSAETAKTSFAGRGNPDLLARSVAFTADGKKLIGVVSENFGAQRVLHVYNPFALTPPALALKGSKPQVTSGTRVTLTVKLGAWAVGRVVGLYATPVGGTKTLVGNVRVGTTGAFTARVRPGRPHDVHGRVRGRRHLPRAGQRGCRGEGARPLKVRASGSYAMSHGVRLFRYAKATCWTLQTKCPTFTVTLAPALRGRR